MSQNRNHTSAVLLAAGNSSRMGTCKFLLSGPNGNSFLETILVAFDLDFIDKIVLVTQERFLSEINKLTLPDKLEFVINNSPEKERFHSLQLGLNQCGDSDFVFIHNTDMPLITKDLISRMFRQKNTHNYVAPCFKNKHGHPILINREINKAMLAAKSNSILREELQNFTRSSLTVLDSGVLKDIDTQNDYKNLFIELK